MSWLPEGPAARGVAGLTAREVAELTAVAGTAVRERRGEPSLEALVGGEVLETRAGPLVVVRREYPLDHRHGLVPLGEAFGRPAALERLAASSATSRAPAGAGGIDPAGLLFLDVETTGLAGGTGTYAFLVGVARLDAGRLVLTQYFMRDFDEEPALLDVLEPVVAGASGLVTYNGAGFDVPLLETRFALDRRRWPGPAAHVDLLWPARRVWRRRWGDCRLATLEGAVLGFVRHGDVPGALVPSLYFEYLRARQPAPLAPVFRHNRDDVLSLVALCGWLARALDGDAGPPRPDPVDQAGLGRLLARRFPGEAARWYERALGGGLDGPPAQRVRLTLAAMAKRETRWEQACAYWEVAASAHGFDLRPWEELAKYHEHQRRDPAAARALVLAALARAEAAVVSGPVRAALDRRLERLTRRLESAPSR